MSEREKVAHVIASETHLSYGEAFALLQRVGDDEALARSLVTTGQAFNVSPWTVLQCLEKN